MTCISNALARRATRWPMRPKPTTPRVLPWSSTPRKLFRSHSPRFIEASAAGTLRARASSIARVCSVAEIRFAFGALSTSTPRRVASRTSTLSTPTPARPTTRRRAPAERRAASTFVRLGTRRASQSPIAARTAARPSAEASTTSAPPVRRISSPAALRGSAIRTLTGAILAAVYPGPGRSGRDGARGRGGEPLAGQERRHEGARAARAGAVDHHLGEGEIEHAEAERAEDGEPLAIDARRLAAGGDVGDRAADEPAMADLLLGQVQRGLRPAGVVRVVDHVV